MNVVRCEREIGASPKRVWGVYTDHVSWQDWSNIGRVRLDREGSDHRDGVGCVRVISKGGVSAYEEVVEFEPPRRMAYRVIKGGLPMVDHLGEVEFEPLAGGERTRVVWQARFGARYPLTGAPMRWIVRFVFEQTLSSLARYPFDREEN